MKACLPNDAPARVSSLEDHLGYWLRFVSNHVSHAFKEKVEKHGVTVAEWVVLRALYDADHVRPSAIAATIGLTRGAVSKLLDRLEGKGLLVSEEDPFDRRSQVVVLCASGRKLVPKLAALADENDAEAFGHLHADERAALASLLKEMAARLGLTGIPLE